MSEQSAFLAIEQLCKQFGSTEVLKDVSIDVEQSGFLVLVGPSGCGKSTLLNMIAGFETVSSGDIRIQGQSINGLHPSRRDIAMVFQSYALYPNMTVAGNIAFGMETRGVPRAEREKRVDEVAATLQIEALLKRKPSQLSGGQRQRVAMGRALVRDPRVFLFDEPLSNLDARLRVDMRAEIKKLHSRLGTTIVYVTHDQVEAMTLATKIAVMNQGVVQQVGTPNEIYNRPANTFVADFMGSPAMNRLPAQLSTIGDNVHVAFGDFTLCLQEPSRELRDLARQNAAVQFGMRAEDIREGVSGANNTLDLAIEMIEPTGSDTYVETRDGDCHFIARVANDLQPRAGERMPLAFDVSRAHFFDQTGQRIAGQ